MRLTMAAILVVCPALSAEARANEPRSHDGGFFLRLAPGGGYARSSITEAGDELELSGVSGNLDIAIGAVVTRNLAIHANLGGWSIVDPTVRFNDDEEQI